MTLPVDTSIDPSTVSPVSSVPVTVRVVEETEHAYAVTVEETVSARSVPQVSVPVTTLLAKLVGSSR